MLIYIDSNLRCHTTDDGTRRCIETSFFDGKCKTFIEGYCFIPIGETWTREDGEVFIGEVVFPVVDYSSLEMAQEQYETDQEQMNDMQSALKILGVSE